LPTPFIFTKARLSSAPNVSPVQSAAAQAPARVSPGLYGE
jgi:hypothetical protein